MPSDVIDTPVSIIQKATGLTQGQAKTCVYYAGTTHRMDDLDFLPMLAALGPPGTGKSTLLRMMKTLCYQPSDILDCDGITVAALRDVLIANRDATVILEEADKAASPGKAEDFLRARCGRVTARIEVKEAREVGWTQKPRYLFGASVLHRRQPFRDQAVQSRAIIIRTQLRKGTFVEEKIEDSMRDAVSKLAKNIDLKAEPPNPYDIAGRVVDVWRPLLLIAKAMRDKDYLLWAWNEMKAADDELRDGHNYEPEALILNRVIELVTEEDPTTKKTKFKSPMDRVKVDESIGGYLRKHYVPYPTPFQVTATLKKLGFVVNRSGGIAWLYPTEAAVKAAAQQIGLDDEVLR